MSALAVIGSILGRGVLQPAVHLCRCTCAFLNGIVWQDVHGDTSNAKKQATTAHFPSRSARTSIPAPQMLHVHPPGPHRKTTCIYYTDLDVTRRDLHYGS
jgi:hypothetical protein